MSTEEPDNKNEREEWREAIDIRLRDLHEIQTYLDENAQKFRNRASFVKYSVIFFGIVIGIKEAISGIVGVSGIASTINAIVFSLIGAIIAALTALEAKFNWEKNAEKLETLASKCRETRQEIEDEMNLLKISRKENTNTIENLVEKKLMRLRSTLKEVQRGAIEAGVDPVKKVLQSSMAP